MRCLIVGILLAGAAGCRGGLSPADGRRPPVILVSIDTLRSDRLSPYGSARVATPAMEAFARDAVTFERAYSHYPLTLPSHATIFTGLLPPQTGVRDNKGYALVENQLTLAERLGQAGYHTAGVVSSMVLGRATGIGQGFQEYDDRIASDDPRKAFPQRSGEQSAALAQAWMEKVAGQGPFFVFLHLYEPHTPRKAPEPYASRYKDPYDAEVAYADHILGGFLDFLKAKRLYDGSLILVLSDHGEGLDDHMEQEHGLFLYRETLQVPLLVKLPGQQRHGERVVEPVGLMDVVPTVLALLKLGRTELPGVALFEAGGRSSERPLYSETFFTLNKYGWSPLKAVISGRLHYVQAPRPELYDLVDDPGERRSLLPARAAPPPLLAALGAIGEGLDNRREMSAEETRQFAALGYVGGFEPQILKQAHQRDPKDHIHEAAELWRVVDQIGKLDSLEPERRAAKLLDTLQLKQEALSRTIAANLLHGGAPKEALLVIAGFHNSKDPETQVVLGEIATTFRHFDLAAQHFSRALDADRSQATAYRGMGVLLLAARRPGEARQWLERAVELDPRLSEAWNGLGVVRAQAGDPSGALEAWRKAVELDPSLRDAWYNMAVVLAKRGERAAAAAALARYIPLAPGPERARATAMLARLREAPAGARFN